MTDPAPCLSKLIAGGFVLIGQWQIHHETGEPFVEGEIPRLAGVYAHVVDGAVYYIGSAQRGLASRMRRYATSKTMRTSQRVRNNVKALLDRGADICVYALIFVDRSMDFDGLPIDLVAGVEEGLIRELRPDWNIRSKGKK